VSYCTYIAETGAGDPYAAHSGQRAEIVQWYGPENHGYEGIGRMARLRFADGVRLNAFEKEVTEQNAYPLAGQTATDVP
jgi:hypothetical protein